MAESLEKIENNEIKPTRSTDENIEPRDIEDGEVLLKAMLMGMGIKKFDDNKVKQENIEELINDLNKAIKQASTKKLDLFYKDLNELNNEITQANKDELKNKHINDNDWPSFRITELFEDMCKGILKKYKALDANCSYDPNGKYSLTDVINKFVINEIQIYYGKINDNDILKYWRFISCVFHKLLNPNGHIKYLKDTRDELNIVLTYRDIFNGDFYDDNIIAYVDRFNAIKNELDATKNFLDPSQTKPDFENEPNYLCSFSVFTNKDHNGKCLWEEIDWHEIEYGDSTVPHLPIRFDKKVKFAEYLVKIGLLNKVNKLVVELYISLELLITIRNKIVHAEVVADSENGQYIMAEIIRSFVLTAKAYKKKVETIQHNEHPATNFLNDYIAAVRDNYNKYQRDNGNIINFYSEDDSRTDSNFVVEKIQNKNMIVDIKDIDNNTVFIYGTAGAGKTTLLTMLQYNKILEYDENKQNSNRKIPVIINLCDINGMNADNKYAADSNDINNSKMPNVDMVNELAFDVLIYNAMFNTINKVGTDTLGIMEKKEYIKEIRDNLQIYCDGLNEIVDNKENIIRKAMLKKICGYKEHHKNVGIIITDRKGALLETYDINKNNAKGYYKEITLKSMGRDDIINYFETNNKDIYQYIKNINESKNESTTSSSDINVKGKENTFSLDWLFKLADRNRVYPYMLYYLKKTSVKKLPKEKNEFYRNYLERLLKREFSKSDVTNTIKENLIIILFKFAQHCCYEEEGIIYVKPNQYIDRECINEIEKTLNVDSEPYIQRLLEMNILVYEKNFTFNIMNFKFSEEEYVEASYEVLKGCI